MGQKTNPIIFKINKTKEWKAKYCEKKSNEFYLYTLQQLEIKKFINNFFFNHKLKINECKINYTNTFLNIYVSYYKPILSVIHINNINKSQKIKLKSKLRLKSKKRIRKILKIFKNRTNVCNFKNYNDLIYLKKLPRIKKKILKIENEKQSKLRRVHLLTHYKQLIAVKKNIRFINLNVKAFLENFFECLNIFLNKKIKISITLESLNFANKKQINKKEHSLIKKKLIKLKKYEKAEFYKEGVNLMYIVLKSRKSAKLLANFISIVLQQNKKHNFFFRFLKTFLTIFKRSKFSSIISIKIQIKGRFNRSRRARLKTLKIGKKMQLLTLDSNIHYAEDISVTSNGTFGIKVWIYEKKELKKLKVNVKWTKKNKIQKNKKRKTSKIRI